MTKTVYAYDGSGKYIGERTLDDTAPPKEKEGHERYYVGGKWEYREVPKPEAPPVPKEDEPHEEENAPVDEMRVAFAEALAAQEERITALEAAKGGEGK